jgi:hypothetical protein
MSRTEDQLPDELRDLLRDTFRERVATPPAMEGMADRAMAGASRARRGRTSIGAAVAVVAVALVGVGLASYLTGPRPAPLAADLTPQPSWLPTEPIGELSVDVAVGQYMYLAGGGVMSLASVVPCEDGRCVRGVWRVTDGYLVSVYNAGAAVGAAALWHVPIAGAPSVVVDGDGALVVSPGTPERPGTQVAWSDDGRLHLGTYVDHRVSGVVSTPTPEIPVDAGELRTLAPRTVVGDAVVLAGPQTSGDADLWDVWFPDRGDYVPAAYPTIALHGTTVDSGRIIGWFQPEPGQEGCLGELLPEEFVPVESACPSPLQMDDRVYPSPNGRWWIVAGDGGMALYDADQIWSGADAIRRWPGPGSADGTWLDGSTFVAVDGSSGEVVTLHADGEPDGSVALATPGPSTRLRVVVDLR